MKTALRASAFIAAAFVIFFFLPSFSGVDSQNHRKGDLVMPQEYYAEQWKRVEEALQKGLPKSALEIVEAIYKRARKEGMEVQIIKAASYRVGLRAELSDAGDSLLIADLQEEIASSSPPARSIFQSLLAGMFWSYYQSHRWVIAGRTEMAGVRDEDFRTWDARRFFDTTRSLFVASLEPVELLGRADVKKYAEIMYHADETDVVYRPTLLDVLADRALSFLENDETDLPRAVREFEVTSLDALGPAADFVSRVFETPRENDPRWTALKCFQSLLRFHLSDPSPEALVDLDLRRLDFARRITFHEEKDDAWRRELERLRGVYRDHAVSSEIAYRLAQDLFDRGDEAAAFAMCDIEIRRFPGSRGATNCKALLSRILEKELRVDVEETIPPDMPFLVAVSHRNIRRVFFRIVPMEEGDFEQAGYSWSFREFLQKVLRRDAVRVFDIALPQSDDFKEHTVDIAGPSLPLGRYILLGSPLQDFLLDTNAVTLTRLQVTRLSLQSQGLSDGTIRCWVRDGETGHPVPEVEVSLYTQEWKSSTSRYERVFVRSLKTGRDGSFDLTAGESPRSVSIVLRKGKDVLSVDESFSPYRRRENEARDRTVFFTDRGLYRPGQILYFKGIHFRTSADQTRMEARPGVNTTVVFLDANGRTLAEQRFITNAYGSFNGSFTVPGGVLTGVMTIRNETGSVKVRVEEYKRPKFEVKFDPVEEAVALGKEVTVRGSARAYADVQIDNAEVRYRVVRRARFPHWWWWSPAPSSPEKEIAHGTVRTDANGRFSVSFIAVPDKSIERASHPVFTYSVTADVTDINGETHSASVSVNAAYTSITLSTDIPDFVNTAEGPALRILTSNINGRPLPVKGSAVLERVRPPDRVLRERFLPRPDRFVMAPDEFHRSFPHDAYGGEADEDSLPSEATLYDRRFETDTAGTHTLTVPNLPPGRYRLTVHGDDPSGDTVTLKRFFTVYDPSSKRMPVTDDALFILLTPSAEPGRTVSFLFGTSFPDARVLYQVEHRGTIVKSEWLVFDREVKSFAIPVEEKHRGGFTVRFAVQSGYRFVCEERFVNVPWTNKQLNIETAVFRDKLKPGSHEEWKLTIRGEKSEAVTAEIVAAMYDASLDALVPFSWTYPRHAMFPSVSPISAHTFGLAPTDLYSDGNWNRFHPPYSVHYPSLHLYLLEHGLFGYAHYGMLLSKAMDASGKGVVNETMVFAPRPQGKEKAEAMSERGLAEERDSEREKISVAEREGKEQQGEASVQPRKRFDETAFFYPTLSTDEQGETILSFTVPEALTRWKLQAFAHTPDMKTGSLTRTAITQKELMVVPNAPRFLREGDEMEFPVKVSNLIDTVLEGTATFEVFDALTMQPLNAAFGLAATPKPFRCARGAGTVVSWSLRVPESVDAVVYRVIARAGAFSDGEEAPLPVLPNRMLVTESMPMNIRGRQTRTFRFEKLASSGASKTLRHRKLTL
ncbi:MAG: alpha-2-macroglobulin family protein, partial [Bacteroidota bacterium]|nr:alpha-2-macroglobulin family protein [Bacteroidota bacterium]